MTRRAFLLVATAYAIGALGLFVALVLIQHQANKVAAAQKRLENLAVSVTESQCLAAYADDRGDVRLVENFVLGISQPLTNPICRRAVEITRRQVEP